MRDEAVPEGAHGVGLHIVLTSQVLAHQGNQALHKQHALVKYTISATEPAGAELLTCLWLLILSVKKIHTILLQFKL